MRNFHNRTLPGAPEGGGRELADPVFNARYTMHNVQSRSQQLIDVVQSKQRSCPESTLIS
jgi:hypothetical protein